MAEPTIEELAANVNNAQFGDDRLGVQFYTQPVEDHERTLTEGRQCFKEREFVKIMVPGDRLNIVDRPVQKTGHPATDERLRFPQQWARFQARQTQPIHDGIPLALWPGISAALVEELKYINIYTVEQLATLADTHVERIPRGQTYKRKAAEYVEATKDAAAINRLQAQLEERDTRIDALEAAIEDQSQRIEQLLAGVPQPKRGRKPKLVAQDHG